MILSFHPIIETDKNILCAGRLPDEGDLAAIQRAEAVILPQGCSEALYRLARANCRHVFPNLDARFDYPGKCGQIRLFRKLNMPHPITELYASLADFHSRPMEIPLPVVIKLDWGGQGETVFKAVNREEMDNALARVGACETTGQNGFLIQQWIPDGRRSLRVTVIGRRRITYWRIQPDVSRFGASLAAGGCLDYDADPSLQAAAQALVNDFCRRSGPDLAGFDVLFDTRRLSLGHVEPLMLEINYFFGRAGLGGSEEYYRLLTEEVRAWLSERQLEPSGR